MSYIFRKLDHRHHDPLLKLAESTSTGSELFRVERSPNFFALPERMGDYSYYGLFKKNLLIGCMGIIEQKRLIHGKVENVHYLFDLRVHPEYRGTRAFYRLIEQWLQYDSEKKQVQWVFSTILDENKNKATLIEGGSLFPKAKILGQTLHVGIPLFVPRSSSQTKEFWVSEASAEEAWPTYKRFAGVLNLALMDEERFKKSNGTFLCVKQDGNVRAVCKLVDQSQERRLILTHQQSFGFKLINILCRMKGCPPLPKKNQMLHHAYLSHYASESEGHEAYRNLFLHYISRKYNKNFTYVFFGINEKEASKFKGLFHIQLSSTTYGFGETPKDLCLDFHELTLI